MQSHSLFCPLRSSSLRRPGTLLVEILLASALALLAATIVLSEASDTMRSLDDARTRAEYAAMLAVLTAEASGAAPGIRTHAGYSLLVKKEDASPFSRSLALLRDREEAALLDWSIWAYLDQ